MDVAPSKALRVSSVKGSHKFAWIVLGVLATTLWWPELESLWGSWQSDPSLSHGPLIPVIAAALIWMRRSELGTWQSYSSFGLVCLVFCSVLYLGAVWADIDFLRPMALVFLGASAVYFLGGKQALKPMAPALGFLAFMIPWPTTLVSALAFPMQLTSSTYAALFGGILGLPIIRDGVNLYVVPNLHAKPVYGITVAQACSGLSSLIVLLAISYLVAYLTPTRWYYRILLMLSVIPMALLLNAVRLTVVLLFGTYYSAHAAQWVHDHEEPVLVLFCSMGLLLLRKLVSKPSTVSSSEPAVAPGTATLKEPMHVHE